MAGNFGNQDAPDSASGLDSNMKQILEDLVGPGFLLLLALVFFAMGGLAAMESDVPARGYFPTVKRIWSRMTEPHMRVQCQNSLKQMALATAPAPPAPLSVQGEKESK